MSWPETGRARRAGVSSFGMSGTNAHVIVEQAPADPVTAPAADAAPAGGGSLPLVPALLSGRTKDALREQAERLRAHLMRHPEDERHRRGVLAGHLAFRVRVPLGGPGDRP